MNFNIPTTTVAPKDQTEAEASQEAIDQAVAALGSAFHEDWRKTRLNEDGTFEPRVKTTKDAAWIEAQGTDQVDIANTTYEGLPADWQGENKAAAEVVVGIFNGRNGNVDLSNPDTRAAVGEQIHAAWLSRNEWAKGGDLDVPFADLPVSEQDKDLDQVIVAQGVFAGEQVIKDTFVTDGEDKGRVKNVEFAHDAAKAEDDIRDYIGSRPNYGYNTGDAAVKRVLSDSNANNKDNVLTSYNRFNDK